MPDFTGWEKEAAELLGEAIVQLAGSGLLRAGMQVTGYHALADVPPFAATMVLSAPFDRRDRVQDPGGRNIPGLTYWIRSPTATYAHWAKFNGRN